MLCSARAYAHDTCDLAVALSFRDPVERFALARCQAELGENIGLRQRRQPPLASRRTRGGTVILWTGRDAHVERASNEWAGLAASANISGARSERHSRKAKIPTLSRSRW